MLPRTAEPRSQIISRSCTDERSACANLSWKVVSASIRRIQFLKGNHRRPLWAITDRLCRVSQWPFWGHNLPLQPRPDPEPAGLCRRGVVQEGLLIARPRERLRFLALRGERGAEGATAPETLRQKDRGRKGALESSGRDLDPGRSPKE